jgi:hypothetical protein
MQTGEPEIAYLAFEDWSPGIRFAHKQRPLDKMVEIYEALCLVQRLVHITLGCAIGA